MIDEARMHDVTKRTAPMDEVESSVRAVYESEHARMWRSLYAFSRSSDVADEALAEAFAQVLRRGNEVRDIRAWVWRTAFAIARGELQRRASRQDQPLLESMDSGTVDTWPTDQGLRRLLQTLGRLSDDDRHLLVLCHVGGWQPTELAPLLGASGPTLRVRLHRATKRARQLLEQEDT